MKNTNVLAFDASNRITRILTLSLVGVVSLLMFSLAVTANAATLTRSLDLGMSGSDVSALQTYLASDGNIYPSGLVTGYFGQLTKAAVERFQTAQGIVHAGTPETTGYGRVGPVTLAALNRVMGGYTGDNSSPVIQSLNVNTSNTTANFNWNTSENASAIVYYDTSFPSMIEGSPTSGVTIGGSSLLVHTDLRTSHTATITSLTPNTTYYYVVYVRDGSGNENITWPSTFRTNY